MKIEVTKDRYIGEFLQFLIDNHIESRFTKPETLDKIVTVEINDDKDLSEQLCDLMGQGIEIKDLEKFFIPKKPTESNHARWCPNCGTLIETEERIFSLNYCDNCGQRILRNK